MKKFGVICSSVGLMLLATCLIIGFILIAGCTGCVKNECKKIITPIAINEYSLTVVDSEGARYEAKDQYVIKQLTINQSNMITYIDGNPKLLVTVY